MMMRHPLSDMGRPASTPSPSRSARILLIRQSTLAMPTVQLERLTLNAQSDPPTLQSLAEDDSPNHLEHRA
jgi:hypothetical protein